MTSIAHLYTHRLVFAANGKRFACEVLADDMQQARKIGESMARKRKAVLIKIEEY